MTAQAKVGEGRKVQLFRETSTVRYCQDTLQLSLQLTLNTDCTQLYRHHWWFTWIVRRVVEYCCRTIRLGRQLVRVFGCVVQSSEGATDAGSYYHQSSVKWAVALPAGDAREWRPVVATCLRQSMLFFNAHSVGASAFSFTLTAAGVCVRFSCLLDSCLLNSTREREGVFQLKSLPQPLQLPLNLTVSSPSSLDRLLSSTTLIREYWFKSLIKCVCALRTNACRRRMIFCCFSSNVPTNTRHCLRQYHHHLLLYRLTLFNQSTVPWEKISNQSILPAIDPFLWVNNH